ncbi:EAL domain-containing protein [Nitrospira defluvii]|nr:EAL domain-containing protein [Nitrospira defluvii]
MSDDKIFIGRQPILDDGNKIVGFEILFRSGGSKGSDTNDLTQASAGAIMNTLSDIGLNEVVGSRHKAFFNVNAEILMSEMIELLPKEQVVIQILDSVEVDGAMINRCSELKQLGFSLALADFIYEEAYERLFDTIDIIKIDIKGIAPDVLKDKLNQVKKLPAKLLAANVQDAEQFEMSKQLGFKLFEGYYFAKPAMITGKKVDLAGVVVMRLMNQVLRDVGLSDIEKTFRESPSLSYNLLTLVNSISMGMREKINSVRHAIVLLGRERLKRWAQVLLFSHGGSLEHRNPLLSTALMRGRFMEVLVEKGAIGGTKRTMDHSFMTGILSLTDSLMGKPMDEIVEQMGLADIVADALLKREGNLGLLLSLVEALEKADNETMASLAKKCKVSTDQLYDAEQIATKWTKSLTDSF